MTNQKNSTTQPVVLVTGASSGMGKAFAKSMLQQGYIVYAVARRITMMSDIEQAGAKVLEMDITNETQVKSVVDTINLTHGGVDILINNAGYGLYGAMEDISLDEARYQFNVNVFGLARITQLVLPAMRHKGAGKIINISSMGGRVYTPLGSWYHASKHAIEGWSDCLRIELKQFGIDVVVIQPGAIATEFGEVLMSPMPARSQNSAYADMARRMAKATADSYEKGGASSTDVITRLVLKAINARKPKTRYVAGKYAKPMMFVRKWFGDRVFDKLVLSMVH